MLYSAIYVYNYQKKKEKGLDKSIALKQYIVTTLIHTIMYN